MNHIKWWGYKHVNGSIVVKRYFYEGDIESAKESEFVTRISPVVSAVNREEALQKVKQYFLDNK